MDYSSAAMAVRSIGRFTGQLLTAIAVLRYHLRAMRTAPAAALAALTELDGFEQGLHQVEKWLGRHDVEAAGDAALLSALSRLNGEVQHAWAEIRIWRDDKSLQRLGGARLNDLAHRFRGARYHGTLVAMARKLAAWRSALSFHLARLQRIYRPQVISKRITKFEYLPDPPKKEAASPFAPMNSAQPNTPGRSSGGGGGESDGGSATSTSASSSRGSSSSTRSSGFSSRPSKGGQASAKPSGTMASSRDEPSSSSAASRRKVRKTSSQFFQQRYHWTCDALYGIDDAFEHHGADGASVCGFCGFKFYWTDDECFARQGRHLVKRHGFGRCGRDIGFASKKDFTRHLVATHKLVVRDFHQGSPVDFADDSWLDRFFRRWGEAPLLHQTAAAAAPASPAVSPVRRNMTTTPGDDGEDDNSNNTKNNNKNHDVAGIGHNHHSNNGGGGGGSTSNNSSIEPQPDTTDALTTLRELAAVLQEAGLAPSLRLRAPRGELTGHPWLQPAYVSALCTSLAKLDDEETVAALGEDRFADVCYVAACLAEDLAVAGHEDLLALESYLSPAHDVVNRVVVAGEAPDRYRAAHRLDTGWEMLVDDGHRHGHGGGSGDAAPARFRSLLDAVRHQCRAAGAEQALSQTNPKSIVRILESARARVMRSSNGYLMRQRRLGRALTTDNLRRLPGLDPRSNGRLSQRIDDWLLSVFVHSIPLRRILMSGMVVPGLATTDPCSWAAFVLEHWDGEPVDTHCSNPAGGGYESLLDSPSSGYFSSGATIGES